MMNNLEILVAIPLFIILLTAIHKPIKEAFNFSNSLSWLFAGAVSILSIIGIKQSFKGSPDGILLLYAVMGISIFVLLLWKHIGKFWKRENSAAKSERYRHKTRATSPRRQKKETGYE